MTHPVLVSACLTGRACRYDGESKPLDTLAKALGTRSFVAVCPEELGGLGTPRPAATLVGGPGASVWEGRARVVRLVDGADLTGAFTVGAVRARAEAPSATLAILKARSPSCGCGVTSVDGEKASGDGVFAALLRSQGVTIVTDEAVSVSGLEV